MLVEARGGQEPVFIGGMGVDFKLQGAGWTEDQARMQSGLVVQNRELTKTLI